MPTMSSGIIHPGTGQITFPDNNPSAGASSGAASSSTDSSNSSGTLTIDGINLGTPEGYGIFSNVITPDPNSVNLLFKSLIAGNGITLSATDKSIVITNASQDTGGGGSGGGITGTVLVSQGGTGLTSIADNTILMGSGTNPLDLIAAPTASNQFLYFDGNQIAWAPFVVQANKIQGLAAVATSGSYTDLINTPTPYTLPIATKLTLGGVIAGSGLEIDSTGILSADVFSVNGKTGDVNLTYSDVGAISITQYGVPNGVATLDMNGKVPYSELPASLLGSLNYKGTWDASANNPSIQTGSASTDNNGWFYIVNVAGTTTVDGTSSWAIGDWIISDGVKWNKIEATNAVSSVNGQTGAVEITPASLGLATVATTGSYTDLINVPNTDIPMATTTTLGGIIVGNGLNISSTGVLSLGNSGGQGVGIVQSVALALPSIFAVNGSPVTSTGTLTGVLLSQAKNTFFAGPQGGSADIPGFREIVGADLPVATPYALGGVSVGAGLSITSTGSLSAAVISFNGRTGAISLQDTDLKIPFVQGVDNPLAGKFILGSPAFYGTPTAPTPPYGDNSDNIATTAFVTNYVNTFAMPPATSSKIGGVSIGAGLTITVSGNLSANVKSFNSRIGDIVLTANDLVVPTVPGVFNPLSGTFLLEAPVFVGNASFRDIPTSPTPPAGDNSTNIATTAFVNSVVNNYNLPPATETTLGGVIVGTGLSVSSGGKIGTMLTSVAGRIGDVTLSVSDVSGAAPIASPTFTGNPAAPTPPAGDSSTSIATTAFVTDYVNNFSMPPATKTTIGGIMVGNGLSITTSGDLSADMMSFNGRIGDVTLLASDLQVPTVQGVNNPLSGTFLLPSPIFTGTPTAPTPPAGDKSTAIATTEFVTDFVNTYSMPPATTTTIGGISVGAGLSVTSGGSLSANVLSVNGKTGLVTLSYSDVGAAPINSPVLTGIPKAPTPDPGDNTTTLATTSFVQTAISQTATVQIIGTPFTIAVADYSGPIINLTGTLTADTTVILPSSGKWSIVNSTTGDFTLTLSTGSGATVDVPQGGIADVIADGGIYLSNEIGVTRPFNDSTKYLATTEFVATALGSLNSGVSSFNTRTGAITLEASDVSALGFAELASPAFTGIPTAPTASVGTSTDQIATTAFVTNNFLASQSPALTGTPTAPTQSLGDNSTAVATTGFVQQYLSSVVSVSLTPPVGATSQSSTMTLTPDQYGAEVIEFVGTPTVAITITFPASGQWMVYNSTIGNTIISFTNGQGAVYELQQNQSAVILSLGQLGIINANIAGNFITPATASTLGGVIVPNGSGLTVDQSGKLSVDTATSSTAGLVSQGSGITISSTGVISADVESVAGRIGNVVLTATDVGLPTDLLSGSGGTLASKYIPSSITGSMTYVGSWNAATNTPSITTGSASSTNKGQYYIVSVAGTTNVDGNSTWNVGDQIVSNGSTWQRIPNSNDVTSVNGQTGAVSITAANLNLATVATSGSYADLTNTPPNPAQASISCNIQGNPIITQDVSYMFSRSCNMPMNFLSSQVFATLASGTSATVGIFKYPVSNPSTGTQIGSVVINTSGQSTFSSTAAVTWNIGDRMVYRFTTTNIAVMSITLAGTWTS